MSSSSAPATVEHVDLNRYMGKWYEIARLPTWFERGCENVSAEYSITTHTPHIGDIRVRVLNQCTTGDLKPQKAEGEARVVDLQTCAKLQVSFLPSFLAYFMPIFPSSGNYWILNLDTVSYSWAMVGNPEKTCLWVLSRVPYLDPLTYRFLMGEAVAKGFDVSRMILTQHQGFP